MTAPQRLLSTALACTALAAFASAQTAASAGADAVRLVWRDFDSDGDVDALVLRPSAGPRLLAGFGDGTFEDATARVGLERIGELRHALWTDLDGDGTPELFAHASDGAAKLLRLDGATYVDVTGAAGLELVDAVRHVEALNVDKDGRVDLHLSTASGELVLRNAGGLRFEMLELGLEPVAAPAALPRPDQPRSSEEEQASTSGAPGATTSGVGSVPGRDSAAGSAFCWDTLEDQATGNCVAVSSIPTLGALLPLGPQLYIDAAGRVGIGTLAPGADLDVIGSIRSDAQLISTATSGPPLVVSSSDVVSNLNADLLDGLSAAELGVFGDAVGTAELEDGAVTASKLALGAVDSSALLDGSVADADVALGAAIAGTKILPDFGALDVTSTGSAAFGDASVLVDYAVRGDGFHDPTRGYLGVQGSQDYDGITGLNLYEHNIGVLGLSEGIGSSDNFGVFGRGTGAGVRGESSNSSQQNFGELGRPGYGVWGTGTTNGGRFESGFIAGQFESAFIAGQFNSDFDGVRAVTTATNGYAIWGDATASSGGTRGVYGRTDSSSGRGVYGHAASSSGITYGVIGRSSSTSGRGVRGEATSTSGTNYGVQGRTYSPSGYGIISYGSSGSTGQKNFIQPHPTDPTLEIHFTSLEGNESGTYFRGSSVLLGGLAEIEVPEAFRMVSEPEDLTVQLTARGPNADLWIVSVDLERVVVRGARDVAFDYQVNGVRRGFGEHRTLRENHAFVPEERGVPYATELPLGVRRLLVANGTLNADFTPNESTAAALGWELRDPDEEAALESERAAIEAEYEAERAAIEAAHAASAAEPVQPQGG